MGKLSGIALGAPFIETLVAHLSSLKSTETLVILGTKNECEALREALGEDKRKFFSCVALQDLRAGDKSKILSPFQQHVLLSRLILKSSFKGIPLTIQTAMGLAQSLMQVLEDCDREGVYIKQGLIDQDRSQYGQYANDLFQILISHWPQILKDLDKATPEQQRQFTLKNWAQSLQQKPSPGPVILSGVWGHSPGLCQLIKVVLRMEQGEVILPGFDREALQVSLPVTHPFYGIQQLFKKLNISASDVIRLGCRKYSDFLRVLMQPAGGLPLWKTPSKIPNIVPLVCRDENLEARTLAVLAREAQHHGRKLCIISPDPILKLRVIGELKRWSITPKTSYEVPLAQTSLGAFCALTVNLLQPKISTTALLSVLKHPLCIFCSDKIKHLQYVEYWEKKRRLPHKKEIKEPDGFQAWFERVLAITKMDLQETFISRHLTLMDQFGELTSSSDPEIQTFWESLKAFTGEIKDFVLDEFHDYRALLNTFLQTRVTVYVKGDGSLVILDPYEAHLCQADTVVLAGLNEGTWPSAVLPSPWLTPQQRHQIGLSPLESQIGQEGYEFCMALGAERVFVTRSLTDGGVLTKPSRWFERLLTILPPGESAAPWIEWAQRLDSEGETQPISRPKPCPSPQTRAYKHSLSSIQRLMRDPYVYYAQSLLGLEPLRSLDQPPGAREWGVLVHQLIEVYTKEKPPIQDVYDWFYQKGLEEIEAFTLPESIHHFWCERWRVLSLWLIQAWSKRQPSQCWSEIEGTLTLQPWQLTGIADRVEQIEGVGLCLIDFKTGILPSLQDVRRGGFPQLPLEGFIAIRGGFPALPQGKDIILEYWHLRGYGDPIAEIIELKDPLSLIEEAGQGVQRLLEYFSQAPYSAAFETAFPDFEPMVRRQEWLVVS